VVSGEIAALNDRIFDVIVAENTLEREPDELFSMLAPRGRLVALVGSGAVGTAFVFTRDNGNVTRHPAFNAGLPPRFAAATGSDFVL
jgi:protein-L-isoaspartate O-methyltransferase